MEPQPLQPYAKTQQQLAGHWQAFYSLPGVRLGRWLVAEADRPLVNSFLQDLSTEAIPPVWPAGGGEWPITLPAAAPAAVIWLTQLPADAEYVLRRELTRGGSQRFIVLEDGEQQPLRRLARWYPALVQTTTPAVSMAGLLQELHELHENHPPTSPEEQLQQQFRQQFRELTQALARADNPAIAPLSEACRHTCQAALALIAANSPTPELAANQRSQEINWKSAEISIWLATGPHYLVQRQPEQALAQYGLALAGSEAADAAGLSELGLLSVHAWLGQAVVWQQRQRYPLALEALQLALSRAETRQSYSLAAEAARQMGLVLKRAGRHRDAATAYEQALNLAELLPPGQRPVALVKEAGAACLKQLHTFVERKALRDRLQLLN